MSRPSQSPGERLDRLSAPVMAAVGLAGGSGLGWFIVGLPTSLAGGLFAASLGFGLWVAASGRATSVVETVSLEPRLQLLEPASVFNPLPVFDPLAMAEIRAGRFVMGSPDDDELVSTSEKPAHEVELSAFSCMVYPVTRGLFARLMGHDPGWPDGSGRERNPANNVSWYDAIEFCNRLSEEQGLAPCYRFIGTAETARAVAWNRRADGYRLPTEAEWERACRAGSQSQWTFGDDETLLAEYAWYDENSAVTDPDTGDTRLEPHPVGQKRANQFGLYDMHGNVWEWCWDTYARYYPELQPLRDPTGPSLPEPDGDSANDSDIVIAGDNHKLLRGGAFVSWARFARCADRYGLRPEYRNWDIGFRCVRDSGRQHGPLNP